MMTLVVNVKCVYKRPVSLWLERRKPVIRIITVATMSVYTVRLSKGNQRPHPDFKNKGLEGFYPCALSNSEVYGIPHKRQVAYGAYTHSLSAFLFATEKGARVSCDAEGYPIQLSTNRLLDTISLVPLGVSFQKKLTVDQIKDLEIDFGVRQVKNMGQDLLIFDKTSLDLARKMKEMKALPDARTPSGVANMYGLQSYLHCMKIVTLFCVRICLVHRIFVEYSVGHPYLSRFLHSFVGSGYGP